MAVSSSGPGRKTDEVHQLTKEWRWREQRDSSPDRSVVWTEPQNGGGSKRVPVLYYLCSRNGQLQHPHFMEVPLSSPQGLFLSDVISRLNVLRGKAMASLYSWSCKRSYKNGFVWHDLSENDFIYPAHGREYVLKGSELPVKALLDAGSSSPPPPPAETQGTARDDLDADRQRRNHSCSSINFEYSVYTSTESFGRSAAANASTQTDDKRSRRLPPPAEIPEEENCNNKRDEIEIAISPPPSDSSPETLETLMKADGRPTARPATSNENPPATTTHHDQRCRSSVLMQLISCGSMPFKDCGAGQGQGQGLGLGLMRVARGGASAESGRGKEEEKQYFSGSIVETKEEEFPSLKRSTSYSADR
ncbi:protein UPSTREAM OF FLC [Sesamum alatum]|uniref:Protein UPSTREAM OF FLC n=1 Tax=Sesamum alatum TaxID=300844 RepID=A0AAE2CZW8_9LAMI|nr:protein UPSTREAM OF FLC [Sesamum alatum]